MHKSLTLEERIIIEEMLKKNSSYSEIARQLKRSISGVWDEIKKNSENGIYNAQIAQNKAINRRKNIKRDVKMTDKMKAFIEEKLTEGWNFEQIYGYCVKEKIDMISVSTMYRLFRKNLIMTDQEKYLRKNGRQYKQKQEEMFFESKSIEERPIEADNREIVGHWELSVILPETDDEKAILLAVDRCSRFLVACFVVNQSVEIVTRSIINMLKNYFVKSITSYKSIEFSNFKEVEKALSTEFYFVKNFKYKGISSNYNAIGLLREYFPKGSSFENYTEQQLQEAVQLINTRPCKILGFKTRQEVFKESMK